ncbi:Somatostatin receptor type 5 [Aphelenchoides fujianensis]|nr:Somatostatin receptor type 5 [Aphelenchoides fujianensis]
MSAAGFASFAPTTPAMSAAFESTGWTAAAASNLSRVAAAATAAVLQPAIPAESPLLAHIRMFLTITHLFLVALGCVNLLVIFTIAIRPYMRSITNVYMTSLCMADFVYLANLLLVAATQLNDKSWPFGDAMCTLYHGTETTGKYASVMFVVLLASDRFCAMCKPNFCARYRNYRVALGLSVLAWLLALTAAFPLFTYSSVATAPHRAVRDLHRLCIIKWPSMESARWYVTFSSVLIFVLPLALIIFFYYHILSKLRQALKGHKRMRRAASTRAPYHRVTRLVLWVVIFHVICWTPFWLFNLFSSIFQWRISTQFDRIVVNVIHLFPYLNCALNPLVYAVNAENFRRAFRSLFCGMDKSERRGGDLRHADDSRFHHNGGISTRSVLGSHMNNSSERLLSINYSSAVAQKCSTSSLLNGSVFLPPTSDGPSAALVALRAEAGGSLSPSLGGGQLEEFRRPSGTVVRFATIESECEAEEEEERAAAAAVALEELDERHSVASDEADDELNVEKKPTLVRDSTTTTTDGTPSNSTGNFGDVFM